LAPDPVPKVTRDKIEALSAKFKQKDAIVDLDTHKIAPLQLAFLGKEKR
jgi:hypothetical protein